MHNEETILIVGAADTGRAPMTVALLQRQLAQRGLDYTVASAGILGHDDDPPESEAKAAMLVFGLEIMAHRARSLNDELVAQARLMIAVESGVARVVRARFPRASIHTLGELAGSARDIPDPFRMQVGAWVHYAHEINGLLTAGMPRLLELLGNPLTSEPPQETTPAPPPISQAAPSAEQSTAAMPPAAPPLSQALLLLEVASCLPTCLDWTITYAHLQSSLDALETTLPTNTLARPYLATLRVMLESCATSVTPTQAQVLHTAFQRLEGSIGASELEALSQAMGRL
ncbi:arsenate reductase/protein-tyrosine-phosphatase family protein [Candidatus Viridilinea mediisalina]|uniref:protein-tyrosine-phosphatase n=1 Tax=Candidatus Viridilinea mediisalina TaxID=2024553 RepID=A0A2A6RGZ3_9CHLR|nr:phosphotyrosine protein phosphatase [Candidatus Viridilinea mediisalina]PDW02337.1 hypothetical protein CJ255_14390 [Candidatus Viridilinea mediisalina]